MNAVIGSLAPDFEMDTYYPETETDEKVKLSDFKGKWLIMFYYPADFTFVCPTELKELSEYHSVIRKAGGEVLAVSTDTVFSHRAWLESERLLKDVRYPMAADHTGKVSRKYGIYDEESGRAQRGAFIIDPDGVLRAKYIVDEPVGRSSAEIVRLLNALKYVRENPGYACPANWSEGAKTLEPSIKIAGHIYEILED